MKNLGAALVGRAASTTMRVLALFLFVLSNTVFAAEPDLIGSWKLVAFQSILDNDPPKDLYGLHPKGYLILTREGRMMTLITAETRKSGTEDPERAALHKSMFAYSGKYRIEGKDFITTVDVSWNEAWNRTEQRRHFRIEGDKLLIETAPAPSANFPGKTGFARLVWKRDK